MSYEENLKSLTREADASLGIYTGVPGLPGSAVPNGGMQYRLVKTTGTHQVGLCTAAGDNVWGVLQNKPQGPGHAATVAYQGVTNVVAGAAISAGNFLVSDAQGRAVPSGTGGTVATKLQAVAAAAAAGELIPALFFT